MSIGENNSESRATAAPPPARRWWTLGVVTLATFMLMLDLTVVNVALPRLRTSLHASFSDLQWVLDSYALTLAVFLLTGGSLADRLGRKRVFTAGFLVFTAASLACGLSWNVVSLDIARGVQGVGAAVLFAVGPALLGHDFHGKERGVAFGVFGGGVGLAIAVGPLIGGALTDGLGWRWIFLVNVPIGVVAMVLGVMRMRESADPRARGTDLAGLLTFCAALSLLILALLRGEAAGWGSGLIVGMFAGAATMLVVFVLVERSRGDHAMLDLSLFRIPTFNGISAVALLYPAAMMSSIFLLVSYVQNVLSFSPWATGLRFLPLTLVLFVMAAIAGGLTVKVPLRLLVGIAGVFIAAGLALVTVLVKPDSSWTALIPTMVLCGIGLGLFNPPRAAISIGLTEPAKAGMASGINETFQQSGVALGIAAFGAFFQARVGALFGASSVGHQLGPAANAIGNAVAAGNGQLASRSLPAGLAGPAGQAAQSAFVNALGDTLLASSGLAAVGALAGFLLIRRKDLHESALAGMPGVPPDLEAAPAPDAERPAVTAQI